MQFVQKVVVIGFKLYTPIAVAEYAHRSLKSKALGFFLTFVGVLTWPVGWSLVNTVTLGIFKSLPAPQNQNFATLMIAIVLAIPVLLWVLIGHVLAPIFVQKVVIRGGAVIQGFAGTVFSAVGASSMAIYSGGLAGSANWLAQMKQSTGRDEPDAQVRLNTPRVDKRQNPSLKRSAHRQRIRPNPARRTGHELSAVRGNKPRRGENRWVWVRECWEPERR